MVFDFAFFLNSALLGVGLAMDAFSVSLANGLNEPKMKTGKLCGIAGTFAFFQAFMPMTGWFFVHAAAERFTAFQKFIPWIALALLAYIGGKMLLEGMRSEGEEDSAGGRLTFAALMVQGVATSIDALSVGFTISSYDWKAALAASVIIATVTFAISAAGVLIGRKFGTKLSDKAAILGGVILIAIGIEIFVKGVF